MRLVNGEDKEKEKEKERRQAEVLVRGLRLWFSLLIVVRLSVSVVSTKNGTCSDISFFPLCSFAYTTPPMLTLPRTKNQVGEELFALLVVDPAMPRSHRPHRMASSNPRGGKPFEALAGSVCPLQQAQPAQNAACENFSRTHWQKTQKTQKTATIRAKLTF